MKQYQVTMPDGSVWGVPVAVIAKSHAEYYAQHETDGDVERCFNEHSLPMLLANPCEVREWAAGNMDWSDVASVAQLVRHAGPTTAADYQEGWVNGNHSVIDVDETTLPPPAGAIEDAQGWVNSIAALPCPADIPPARRGMVEVAELRTGGNWEFGYRLAFNLERCEGVKLFWRYLPDAPSPRD